MPRLGVGALFVVEKEARPSTSFRRLSGFGNERPEKLRKIREDPAGPRLDKARHDLRFVHRPDVDLEPLLSELNNLAPADGADRGVVGPSSEVVEQ